MLDDLTTVGKTVGTHLLYSDNQNQQFNGQIKNLKHETHV